MLRRACVGRSIRNSVRVPRRGYASDTSQSFVYDTRLTPFVSKFRLEDALETQNKYWRCFHGNRMYVHQNHIEVAAEAIRHLRPNIESICEDSPDTLLITNVRDSYTITHTPHAGVSPYTSQLKCAPFTALASIPRSPTIRSLNQLEAVLPYHRSDDMLGIIASTWKKIHAIYSANHSWPIISEGDKHLIEEIRPLINRWIQAKDPGAVRPKADTSDLIEIMNRLIYYGDDGFVILQPYLDMYAKHYARWDRAQMNLKETLYLAQREHELADELYDGRTVDDLAKTFPEGSIDRLVFAKDAVKCFNAVYPRIKGHSDLKEWLWNTRLSHNLNDWPIGIREGISDAKDDHQKYIILRSIQKILQLGWHGFVIDHINKHCLEGHPI